MDLEEAYDKIYRYAYFKMGNRTVAEDITQETFLRFISKYNNIHDYDMRFLYTIARNLCIDEYRRVKPEPLPEEEGEWAVSPGETPEDRLAVREALNKLSSEDRELLLLRYVNDESVGTIAKTLKISRFAVYRRIKAAEERLRQGLEVEE